MDKFLNLLFIEKCGCKITNYCRFFHSKFCLFWYKIVSLRANQGIIHKYAISGGGLMSKYVILILSVALFFVHTVAFGFENRILGADALCAQDTTETLHTSTPPQDISVYYENNAAYPRWQYADDVEAYRAIAKTVKDLSKRQTSFTVIVEGAASPVGSEAYNFRLALQRANILRDIIYRMEGGDKLKICTISAGENWATFQSYVEMMYHEPNRERVLAILRTKISNDEKERRLQALDKGKTWRVLVDDYMGPARSATVVRIVENEPLTSYTRKPLALSGKVSLPELMLPLVVPFQKMGPTAVKPLEKAQPKAEATTAPIVATESAEKVATESAEKVATESVAKESVVKEKKEKPIKVKDSVVVVPRIPVVAFRSNLLVPALNAGIEVPIGKHWSVGADYYFPWIWPKKDNKNCFEFLGWGIEGRYWFGKNRTAFDRLKGHSVGLYGYVGYYDFERNFHGHQGEFVNVGVDYTYAMAVGKRKALHLEFSLGVGYIYSEARQYTVIEANGPLISDKVTKKVGYFGPTKANISLVVPIFQKVKPSNKAKGNE